MKIRKVIGLFLYIILAIPFLVAITVHGLSVHFIAFAEATVSSLIDGNNWFNIYEDVLENLL